MENKASTQSNEPVKMTQRQFDDLLQQLNSQSNFTKGIVLALVMGILGAAIWAAIVWITQYNIGLIAILVGFLVSQGFVFAGRGSKQIAGIIAAVIAVLAILVGNIAVLILQVAQYYNEPVLTTLAAIDWAQLPGVMIESSSLMDLLFYFFALQIAFTRSYVRESKLNVIIVPEGSQTTETITQDVSEDTVVEETAGDKDVL